MGLSAPSTSTMLVIVLDQHYQQSVLKEGTLVKGALFVTQSINQSTHINSLSDDDLRTKIFHWFSRQVVAQTGAVQHNQVGGFSNPVTERGHVIGVTGEENWLAAWLLGCVAAWCVAAHRICGLYLRMVSPCAGLGSHPRSCGRLPERTSSLNSSTQVWVGRIDSRSRWLQAESLNPSVSTTA